MMKIAYSDIYETTYEQDRCFNLESCKIGQNLLLPQIKLQERLIELGHEYHTMDMYNPRMIDLFIFQDIPDSVLTRSGFSKYKYYVKKIMNLKRKDKLKIAVENTSPEHIILIMQEPPLVSPKSYDCQYHKLFGKILTWDDALIDNKKYFKFFYPQPKPERLYHVAFNEKNFITMIVGNKSSNYKGELYSERVNTAKFLEENNYEFDLYGIGWDKKEFVSYRGSIDDKLEVLSHYKFAICYENMTGIKGYITEKIFDCFFAGVIPIYWGADNIIDYIPKECFIDRRKFTDLSDLFEHVSNISEEEYNEYLSYIKSYLKSDEFKNCFSVESYVNRMVKYLI